MKKRVFCLAVAFCLLFSTMVMSKPASAMAASKPVSAIFGGGPLYQGGQAVMDDLRASGFNTIMIWSIHVNKNGDLVINDSPICSQGFYCGDEKWKTQWATLKQAPTSIDRIEVSIGAWGCSDFENIRDLIKANGTGPDTILYRNFSALKEATGADAVDYDDESCYDVDSAVRFGKMCSTMGYKVSLCPYTNSSFWRSVKTRLGSLVDRVYLQCYAGGSGNSPASWSKTMGTKVIPGLWCINDSSGGDSAERVHERLTGWKASSWGGFMWLYDDMMKLSKPNSTADYAEAINRVAW